MNYKGIRRLWREEGLCVPQRCRKKRRTGLGPHVGATRPIVPYALWTLDLQFDTTFDHRKLKMLNVINELTRECLASVVARPIDADAVVATFDRLAAARGTPGFVRFDSGLDVAHAVVDWCRFAGARTVLIDPGSSWRNVWIESFNGRCPDELLNLRQLDSPREARALIEDWRIDYHRNLPHTAHGDLAPTEFATAWSTKNQPKVA